MKKAQMSTQCPCGSQIDFKIGKPTALEQRVAKIKCSDCLSKFLVKVKKGPDQSIDLDFEAINITQRTRHIVGVDLGLMEAE